MRQQGFIGPGYLLPSPNVDAQRLVNKYLEVHEAGGGKNGEILHLRSRHKLVLKSSGSGPSRGGFTASNGKSYCVNGSTLYDISDPASPSSLGTLNTSTGRVGLADNGNELLVVDGTYGYVLTFSTAAFAQITDTDFPAATMCAFLDQYLLVIDGTTGRFYFSELSDATDWNGLDFATAEGFPDDTKALIADHRQIFLFGEQTVEVWWNDGQTPFSRIQGAYMEQGIASPWTAAKIDNTVFWVGQDANGRGIVYRAGGEGYTPQRVSTFALEYQIATYGDIADASAWTFQSGGHSFYCLNFPNSNTTWVYDIATSARLGYPVWHEEQYTLANGQGQARHRAEWHCVVGSQHIIGDYENGNLYELQDPYLNDSTEYSDDGQPILRRRSAPHVSQENKRISISEITLDMETGIGRSTGQALDPQVMLRVSKDGGHTWGNEKWKSAGKVGEYRKRVKWNRLGEGRDWVFDVQITDPTPTTLISGFGELEVR